MKVSTPRGPNGEREPAPSPATILGAAVLAYGGLAAAAWLWLWLRDREARIVEQAIGQHGPVLASGVGALVGVTAALALRWALRRSPSLREPAGMVQDFFAGLGDRAAVAVVLLAAVAEELFFRLAVQDTFGLLGSVAASVLANASVGRWSWLVVALLHALLLGLLVELGFGLLASSTAHAVLNYLTWSGVRHS